MKVRNTVGGRELEGEWGLLVLRVGDKKVELEVVVVEGGAGVLIVSEEDGRKVGIRVEGIPAFFPSEEQVKLDEE